MRSIDDQLVECVGWCPPILWNPLVIVRDSDRSASQWRTKEREGFDEAMALIESGKYGGFASWEPSRAARDLEVFVQLRKACRKAGVLYLTHGRVYDLNRSDDSFSMGFEFLRAEADADTMRERQLRTVRLNAQKGRPHGRLPYGYRRVYDEHTGELLRQEPDPVTGPLVQEMARRVLAGETMHAVAMSMQDRGMPASPRTPARRQVRRAGTPRRGDRGPVRPHPLTSTLCRRERSGIAVSGSGERQQVAEAAPAVCREPYCPAVSDAADPAPCEQGRAERDTQAACQMRAPLRRIETGLAAMLGQVETVMLGPGGAGLGEPPVSVDVPASAEGVGEVEAETPGEVLVAGAPLTESPRPVGRGQARRGRKRVTAEGREAFEEVGDLVAGEGDVAVLALPDVGSDADVGEPVQVLGRGGAGDAAQLRELARRPCPPVHERRAHRRPRRVGQRRRDRHDVRRRFGKRPLHACHSPARMVRQPPNNPHGSIVAERSTARGDP